MTRTRVSVLTTGGTIASFRAGDAGVIAGVGADALVAGAVPGDDDVRVEELFRAGSYELTLTRMAELAERIRQMGEDPACAGVVVTHGTDTMEESAYLADLGYPGDKPVVFTGAQLPADDVEPDGPANLRDAIRLARDPHTRGLGVLICMAGAAYAAAEATKAHSTAPDPWGCTGLDPVALVEEDRTVTVRRRPSRPPVALAVPPEIAERRVELIKVAAGSDGALLRAARDLGAEAVVLEAFGLGNVPPPVTAAVAELVSAGLLVLVVTRCGAGPTAAVYGNGGGVDLQRAGALLVSHLSGPKARILAVAALAASSSTREASTVVADIAAALTAPPQRCAAGSTVPE